jgi:hypothetical protein
MCDYSLQTSKRGQPKLATSYSPVALALEQEAFQHRKTSTSRFAYFQGQNCHLRTRSGSPVCVAVEQKYSPPQNGDLPAGQSRLPARPSRCVRIS